VCPRFLTQYRVDIQSRIIGKKQYKRGTRRHVKEMSRTGGTPKSRVITMGDMGTGVKLEYRVSI